MNRAALYAALAAVSAMGTAHAERFTYHGRLQDAGAAANGRYDLRLTLYSSAQGGAALAAPVDLYGVDVRDGSFSAQADFGTLSGLDAQAWLEIALRPTGGGGYARLDGRSPVAPDTNACPGAWSIDGNAANPANSYFGTADAQDVLMKANGTLFLTAPSAAGGAVGLSNASVSGAGLHSTALGFAYAAQGYASISGGYSAGALHDGSIVWGDKPSTAHEINDSAANQFIVQANGGVGINTSHAEGGTAPLDATMTVALPSSATGTALASIKLRGTESTTTAVTFGGLENLLGSGHPLLSNDGHNADDTDRTYATFTQNRVSLLGSTTAGAFSVGSDASSGNGAYLTTGGTWTNASSRSFKDGFAAVNVEGVLEKLVALPVQTWFYKQAHAEGLHMGPVAEDFAGAFGLGNDDKHVGTVDESGVAFAAIQGLNRKVESRDDALERENAALRSRLDTLSARLEKLEQRGEQ